jgi:hypothetical protein
MVPLWYRQKELLKIHNDEYRLNKDRNQRVFHTGDLVIVPKQVKSDAKNGRPEKMRMKGRGPCRVLEKVGTDSYKIQKIPVLPGVRTKPGKKEGAFRLERIPDTDYSQANGWYRPTMGTVEQ